MRNFSERQQWDALRDLKREVVRLVDTFEPLQTLRFGRLFPAIDVFDEGDRFILTAELPGQLASDFELTIQGEQIGLRGERKLPEGITESAYHRRERPSGAWSRTVKLPSQVDSDQATAEFNAGILTVSLPKAGKMKPKRIYVNAV
jgi:HSP20 family protein